MDEITLRKVEAKKEKESSSEYSTFTVVSKSPPSPTSPSRTCLRQQKPQKQRLNDMLQSASPVIDVWLSACGKNQTSISDESLTSLSLDQLPSGAVKCGTGIDKLFSRHT